MGIRPNPLALRAAAGSFIAVVCGLLVSASCTPSTPTRPRDVEGSWTRRGDAFPPVHLALIDSAGALHARLRLSGTDSKGVATLAGKQLRLVLENRQAEILGEFVSQTELRLRLRGGSAYSLYREAGRAAP